MGNHLVVPLQYKPRKVTTMAYDTIRSGKSPAKAANNGGVAPSRRFILHNCIMSGIHGLVEEWVRNLRAEGFCGTTSYKYRKSDGLLFPSVWGTEVGRASCNGRATVGEDQTCVKLAFSGLGHLWSHSHAVYGVVGGRSDGSSLSFLACSAIRMVDVEEGAHSEIMLLNTSQVDVMLSIYKQSTGQTTQTVPDTPPGIYQSASLWTCSSWHVTAQSSFPLLMPTSKRIGNV